MSEDSSDIEFTVMRSMNHAPEEMHEATFMEAKAALGQCEGFLLMTFSILPDDEEKVGCGMFFTTGELTVTSIWPGIVAQMDTLAKNVYDWAIEDELFDLDDELEDFLGDDDSE